MLFAGDYPQNEDTPDFLNVTLSEHAVLAKDKLNDHVQFPGEKNLEIIEDFLSWSAFLCIWITQCLKTEKDQVGF